MCQPHVKKRGPIFFLAICAIEHVTHDYYFHYFLHKYSDICPSAGPILAETEKPKVLSNFFENRNRSEPTSVKHKEPNKNRNRNWEPRVTGSVEIEQNQANFLQNVAILD